MTFERVLVPLDGSAASETVLAPLAQLLPANGTVWLHHVLTAMPSTDQDLVRAHAYLDGVRTTRGLRLAQCIVGVGRPADQIVLQSMELGADLVAMTAGGGGLLHELLGGVTDRVLLRCAAPVLLSSPSIEAPGRGIRRILVALEDPGAEDRLIPAVRPLLLRLSADLVCVYLRAPQLVTVDPMGGIPILWPAGPAPVPEELAERLAARGLAARAVVAEGDPAEAILREAASTRADLIVMCRHPQGPVGRLLEGAVWRRVLASATRPLLLVRAA